MNQEERLYSILRELEISYEVHEHPEAPTIEIAMQYWKDMKATHCKNLFFRNHKGNQHYLVVLDCRYQLHIRDLEQRLKQGKLTISSEQRLLKYLGVTPGSVTPFGLINDHEHHVYVFLDKNLKKSEFISFHPLRNTASLILKFTDFVRFIEWTGNACEFTELYDISLNGDSFHSE